MTTPAHTPEPTSGPATGVADILTRLERAHLMGCSDPTDPSRRTTYGEAAEEIRTLRARLADERSAALRSAAQPMEIIAGAAHPLTVASVSRYLLNRAAHEETR